MIKIIDRIPKAYTNTSRDFQVIGRLFDASFNANKTAADTMINNQGTKNIDYRFLTLACNTLGFNFHGSYTTSELVGVLGSFKTIIKNKGNIKSIQESINLLLNSQSIRSTYYIQEDDTNKSFTIFLPEETKNVKLLEELFDYILPAGWVYSIILRSVTSAGDSKSVKIKAVSTIRNIKASDSKLDISNYLDNSGKAKNLDYIGQVPDETAVNNKFVAPVVNFDTVISTIPEQEDE